ncbi:ATP-binding cassette domain-containing protein [Mycoplasmopsis cynos]|uniref:ATP-binding cassette domain-containing protein n=1 Tax=Mycoplasmopsis cynos TaxID=171284 RepID=UPI0022095DD8|nr:ATP-binding cassette domain-containing protein [Mycoplasmopsis cynos]UWV82488.1 ATP-binding cassette domain-containing protein [Mycoplasmopsis cynos]UWV93765.1 ATP-binding cassette domain-containing protein [Mycoplasmopsis cynos]WAM06261.1 ATP-binding cassette domain-containing protein [Mycoplasmopsis cynos]WAM10198.1 ATP-binding cassette domain-containing protein [Mycoplasmopsis cynos]
MKFIKAKIGYEKNIILEDVNLTLKIGELNGIIGKSGVGKSTILKSFFDLDLILEGSLISKDHKDVKMLSKKEKKLYKSSIFYLRPDNNFLEELDFFQNILLGFRKYKNIFYQLFKILTKSQKNYLFDLLKYFNVEELAFEKIANLSSVLKTTFKHSANVF